MRLPVLFILIVATIAVNAQLVINEVCSRNNTVLEDEFGDHPDWIEIVNVGDTPIDIGGHFLSDKYNDLTRFQLPTIQLAAGEYRLFFSGGPGSGDHYFDFGIAGEGESIYLSDPALQIIDQATVPLLHPDHSFGRTASGVRFFDQPTPAAPNSSPGYAGYAPEPIISPSSDQYGTGDPLSMTAALDGAIIHYTLNGSEPTTNSAIYSGPFTLNGNTVLRAIAIGPDHLPSFPVGASFLITAGHELPVISIAVDPDSMFHEEYGIYMHGPNADTVHPFWGANFWEGNHIPAHFEYFENGLKRVSQKIDLRMHGGSSARPKPQRPFRLTARDEYGAPLLDYPFFPERPGSQQYEQLVLRNSGGDFCLANFRDGLFHQIALHNELDVDVLAFKPTAVYINGAYWGMMNLRERIRVDQLATKSGVAEDDVILLDGENDIIQGDTMAFFELTEYIRLNDMSDAAHFAHVDSLLDINSFIDYFCLEMFAGNVDWPANNIRYWKPSPTKGKWRYLLHDLDATTNAAGYIPMDIDMFYLVLVFRAGYMHSEIFRGLLSNDEFKRNFINRLADLMNTAFSPDQFQKEIDLIIDAIDGEIQDHYQRWECWFPVWQLHAKEILPEFARVRPGFMREDVLQKFDLPGTVQLEFEVFPPGGGAVRLNSIRPALPFQGIYFNGNPIDLSLDPQEGYSFDHWEYSEEPEYADPSISISRNFPLDGRITAILRKNGEGLMAWPNPASDRITAAFNASGTGQAHLSVHDAQGRSVYERTANFHNGTNRIDLDLATLSPGVFIITVDLNGERRTTRMVKLSPQP